MEIGVASSSLATSYVPRSGVADGLVERARQVSRDSVDAMSGGIASQNIAADSTKNADVVVASKAARETRDAQKDNDAAISWTPRTQFKDSEGTRVMEVYDSKNVLIYQVPPKGLLMLIHSEDKQRASQVETSA
jgi:hypothetical protein